MRRLCEHTSLTHLTTSTKYTCGLSIGINVLPDFWHRIWACALSTSAANGRHFTVRKTPISYSHIQISTNTSYKQVSIIQLLYSIHNDVRSLQITNECKNMYSIQRTKTLCGKEKSMHGWKPISLVCRVTIIAYSNNRWSSHFSRTFS